MGVDPSTTDGRDSDLTGIIVAGYAKNHAYVLADYSVKTSPDKWAMEVIKAYQTFGASLIVVEHNQGGMMCEQVMNG